MHQYNIPTLVQLMACRLDGVKPLSEPMLSYCQLDPKEHISVKFYSNLKFKSFHPMKCSWKCHLPKWWPFCVNVLKQAPSHYLNQCWLLSGDVLKHSHVSHFTVGAQASILYNKFENYTFKNSATSLRDQWVNNKPALLESKMTKIYVKDDWDLCHNTFLNIIKIY